MYLKKWVGPDPEKHIGSTPLGPHVQTARARRPLLHGRAALLRLCGPVYCEDAP